ncbi:MAG: hypothetical protein WBW92_04910, partial [Rhodanobacteraceae bacterium]
MFKPSAKIRMVIPLMGLFLAACAAQHSRPAAVADGSTANLTILETTDLHSNILSFDYYRLQPDRSLGFE